MGGSRRHLKRNKPKVRVRLPKQKNPAPPAVRLPESHVTLEWDRNITLRANYEALGLVSKPSAFQAQSAPPSTALASAEAVAATHTDPSGSPGRVELVRIVGGRVVSARQAGEGDAAEAGEVRVLDCAVRASGPGARAEQLPLTAGEGTDADFFGRLPDAGGQAGQGESHELQATLGRTKRQQDAPPQRLTKMQRVHVGRLIAAHGTDYQAMSRDMKLNKMQHTTSTLRVLCERYIFHEMKGSTTKA